MQRPDSQTAGAVVEPDLALLWAAVALTRRRVNVRVEEAFELLHERALEPEDFVRVRMAIRRLERAGLLRTDASLHVEPTPEGLVAVERWQADGVDASPPVDRQVRDA
jgi:hypothetical protein